MITVIKNFVGERPIVSIIIAIAVIIGLSILIGELISEVDAG